jgi:hypothetical protein
MLAVDGPFPVAGPASWSNDWHARRCEPYPHLHQGIDILAASGTPLVAVVSGRVTKVVSGSISGLSVEIADAGGTQYFYAHLSRFAPGVGIGDEVAPGEVLGYVGDTGNADGGPPHLHLEVQPGGVPVPPISYVGRWLAVTERRARSWVASLKERPSFPAAIRSPYPSTMREAGLGAVGGEIGWPAQARPDLGGSPLERWPGVMVAATALVGLLGSRLRPFSRRRRRSRQPTSPVRDQAGQDPSHPSALEELPRSADYAASGVGRMADE